MDTTKRNECFAGIMKSEYPAKVSYERYNPMVAGSREPDFLDTIENDPNFALAKKLDGFREVFYAQDDGNRLLARSGADHSHSVPHLLDFKIPGLGRTVLDCEGVAPLDEIEDAKSIFGSGADHALAWQKENGYARLVAFDCLAFDGYDITHLPLWRRRKFLIFAVETIRSHGITGLFYEVLVTRNKREFFEEFTARGGEGVMVKSLSAPYAQGKRTDAWIKVKKVRTWDVVILGFTPGRGKYEGAIGAIMFGFYNEKDNKVHYVGKTSGMTDAERKMFADNPDNFIGRAMEIKGQQVGRKGGIRFPRFVQMRDDKTSKECVKQWR